MKRGGGVERERDPESQREAKERKRIGFSILLEWHFRMKYLHKEEI